MNKYFFILGRNRMLSAVEVVMAIRKVAEFSLVIFENEVLIIETTKRLNLTGINEICAGLVKCGRILKEEEKGADLNVTLATLFSEEIFCPLFMPFRDKKVHLGFSLYLVKEKLFSYTKRVITDLFITLKKELKIKGIKIRIVTSSGRTLSSVVIKKNKLISQGSEVDVFIFGSKIMFGRTEAIQDFEGFNFRDFQRPARDMKIGLMPPKLARLMINISGAEKNKLLLDPFCGCGTILEEAMLLGFKNVIGTDVSQVAVDKTKMNLAWLKEKYKIQDGNLKIIKSDIKNISHQIKEKIDLVVTEPYLGPILRKKPGKNEAKKILNNVMPIYLDFFKNIREVLKKEGKVVMIWPVFPTDTGFEKLMIEEAVCALGFIKCGIIPDDLKKYHFSELTRRGSAIYSREEQNVLREIFIFQYA